MREYVDFILETLNYPHGEFSQCGHFVYLASEVKELKSIRCLYPTPEELYNGSLLGGLVPAELLWDKLLLLWLFQDDSFRMSDWGAYKEGEETIALPTVIRNPLVGFSSPIKWRGADCDPYTLLCLARYYDYGAVCIRFLRKWWLRAGCLYEGADMFKDRTEYLNMLTEVNKQALSLEHLLLEEVPALPDFTADGFYGRILSDQLSSKDDRLDAIEDYFRRKYNGKESFIREPETGECD